MVVKVVKCSYDKKCWYYNAVGSIFNVWPSADPDWFVVHSSYLFKGMPQTTPEPFNVDLLLIHRNDIVRCQ